MKKVMLWRATAKEVATFSFSEIPVYNCGSQVQFAHGDPEYRAFLKSEISVEHCQIERFVWKDGYGSREVFVAFDNALLELIGCKQDQVNRMVEKLSSERNELYKTKLDNEIRSMSFWQKIKFAFNVSKGEK